MMDQRGGDNESQSQNTNHSSTINIPSLSLGGQQASILQVGGQSFLILALGQQASPLQGLGLNLVPVGGPDGSLFQTGGPQAQVLQVGGAQPAISQIDGSKPLLNPTGRVAPNTVQSQGLQTATLQVNPGVQSPTIQANEFRFNPSQSSPLTSTVQVGELLSSMVQGRPTVPPQPSILLVHAPEIKSEPDIEDSIETVITQTGGAMPPLNQAGRSQHSSDQVGGFGSSSVQMGSTIQLEKVKTEPVPLVTSKVKVQSATEKTFNQDVVQSSGVMPPLNQIGKFHPNIVQFGGLQSPSGQGTSAVPMQAEFSHAKIKTEPALEDKEINPLTIQASGRYGEIANLISFAASVQSTLFQPSLGFTGGLQPLGHQENAKNVGITKKNKQSSTKKGTKCQQETPKYVDVACTAQNLVKMKNAFTNTIRRSKSIGTQAKISLKNKSQAVQFPENSHGKANVSAIQECSTQSESSFWPGQVGFRQSCESHPYKVVIVRDPEPENVSVFLSETRGDSERTCDMEGVEKWLHGSYEAEHPHFDDVAVYFTEEEWTCLNDKEKNLYKKVMMDNYWNLMAVGKISVTPPMIAKMERGEEPCMRSLQQAERKPSPHSDGKGDPSSQNISGEYYNIQGFYERLKMATAPIRLAMAGMTVTKIMSDPSFPEPCQAAQAEDKIRDPGEQCPFKIYLNEKPVINERPFRCFKCERTFKRFVHLSSHYQRAHQSDGDLTCSECGKKFSKMKALLLHYMRHTGERPFVCTGCGKTFTSQICLNNHYGLNSKKKQYECYECGKLFGLKHSLLKHEKLHQQDNHNMCLICGKQFLHKSGLRLHESTHGSCVCSHCGRYFSCKEDCEKHMLDHRQVQLFVCAQCGDTFISESQLIEHQKLHQIDYTSLDYPDLLIKVKGED
ncbi:uncharacterized protein ACMZJ9_016390 [Mantella aurantiaca]